jgi:hypothetical protein
MRKRLWLSATQFINLLERLDAIDAALIATAELSIDFASYALTDPMPFDVEKRLHDGVGRPTTGNRPSSFMVRA